MAPLTPEDSVSRLSISRLSFQDGGSEPSAPRAQSKESNIKLPTSHDLPDDSDAEPATPANPLEDSLFKPPSVRVKVDELGESIFGPATYRSPLEHLPQELYDTIFRMVFTSNSDTNDLRRIKPTTHWGGKDGPKVLAIGYNCLPREVLNLLSVNRATRQYDRPKGRRYFAKSYFAANFIAYAQNLAGMWFDSLEASHAAEIKSVTIVCSGTTSEWREQHTTPSGVLVQCEWVQSYDPYPYKVSVLAGAMRVRTLYGSV